MNEAADRLRAALSHSSPISISPSRALADLDEALADERRVTVERILPGLRRCAERFHGLTDEPPHQFHVFRDCPDDYCAEARAAILDEEANNIQTS